MNHINHFAFTADHILGIVIAGIIIIGVVAYFFIDRYRDKKYIKSIEARREEIKRLEAEKEILRAEYKSGKKDQTIFIHEVDLEAARKERGKLLDIKSLIKVPVSAEDTGVIKSEDCEKLIVKVIDKKVYNQKQKTIIITTTQLNSFEDGDVVNPVILMEKGIIPKYSNYYLKVQAKAPLKKVLSVQAHEFEIEAAKMILLTGGEVVRVI